MSGCLASMCCSSTASVVVRDPWGLHLLSCTVLNDRKRPFTPSESTTRKMYTCAPVILGLLFNMLFQNICHGAPCLLLSAQSMATKSWGHRVRRTQRSNSKSWPRLGAERTTTMLVTGLRVRVCQVQ